MLDLEPIKEWLERHTSDEFRDGRHLLSLLDGEADEFICGPVYALVAEVERLRMMHGHVQAFMDNNFGMPGTRP